MFCAHCGSPLRRHWFAEAQRARRVCTRCTTIAYENPKVLVTTIVTCNQRVLLCLRADPPSRDRWTAPTGFMECGETLEEAAAREIFEETKVPVRPNDLRLYALSTLRDISEVYVSFRATVDNPRVECGPECLDVRYFSEEAFPWDRLAYPEMIGFFRLFFRERRTGAFSIHLTHLDAAGIFRSSHQVTALEHIAEAPRAKGKRAKSRARLTRSCE